MISIKNIIMINRSMKAEVPLGRCLSISDQIIQHLYHFSKARSPIWQLLRVFVLAYYGKYYESFLISIILCRELARLTSTREEVRVDIGLEQLHLQRRIRQLQATTSQAASLSGQRANMEQVNTEAHLHPVI